MHRRRTHGLPAGIVFAVAWCAAAVAWSAVPRLDAVRIEVTITSPRFSAELQAMLQRAAEEYVHTVLPDVAVALQSTYTLHLDIREVRLRGCSSVAIYAGIELSRFRGETFPWYTEVYWRESFCTSVSVRSWDEHRLRSLRRLVDRFRREWLIENKVKRPGMDGY
jgi:hypothetical protein